MLLERMPPPPGDLADLRFKILELPFSIIMHPPLELFSHEASRRPHKMDSLPLDITREMERETIKLIFEMSLVFGVWCFAPFDFQSFSLSLSPLLLLESLIKLINY